MFIILVCLLGVSSTWLAPAWAKPATFGFDERGEGFISGAINLNYGQPKEGMKLISNKGPK